jgi:hypothetical protein
MKPFRHLLVACTSVLSLLAPGFAISQRPGDDKLEAGTKAEQLFPTGGYKGEFNNDDQGHADFCVKLKKPVVALRYANGMPSGFTLTEDILIPQAGSGVWCPAPGMARLDAREFVMADDGSKMLFHRGGWGFAGNDPASAVHYGHILVSDIDSVGLKFVRTDSVPRLPGVPRGQWVAASTEPWSGIGQQNGNGSPCHARSAVPYIVSVRSIPPDMNYLNSAQTATIPYAIYGDPPESLGPQADRARGVKYTLLEWSWINVRGGGVARALVRNGDKFYRCADVPPIQLLSVADAQTKTPTGWVEAMYGAIRTSDDGWLYGWIVSAHRHGDEPIVKHLTQ